MKNCFGILVVIAILAGCESNSDIVESPEKVSHSWTCDAESTSQAGNAIVFGSGSTTFAVGEAQSDEAARSGKYCAKLDKDLPYGMTFHVENVEAGDAIEISVWRKADDYNLGALVVDSEDGKFYQQVKGKIARDGDWELIKGLIYVETPVVNDRVKCFIFNNDSRVAYFDDFEVVHHKGYEYPVAPDLMSVGLALAPDKIRKLRKKREEALAKGVLLSTDNDWVPGTFTYDDKTYRVDVRLKGDWLDHLKGIKWSYRIKVRGGSFMGMRSFSLHTPAARNHVDEWIIHKMFEEEDVLTTRYGFVNLAVNGEARGVYAFEEHFDKQLVEHKKRREGPLIKLDESAAFQLTAEGWANDQKYSRALLTEMSEIMPFKASRTRRSPVLRELFIQGQKLLYQHQHNLKPASEIYDIEKLATLYALSDVAGTHHGLAWHNQRFYMNPVTCQLEPIAYDCFTNWVEVHRTTLSGLDGLERDQTRLEYFRQLPFQDPEFSATYSAKLDALSKPEYIENFFAKHADELASYEAAIGLELRGYQLLMENWTSGAAYVVEQKPAFDEAMASGKAQFSPGHAMDAGKGPFAWSPVESQSIKAYLADSAGGRFTLDVINTAITDLELMGFGTKVSMAYPLKKAQTLEPHHKARKKYRHTVLGTYAYFRVPGQPDLQKREITWFPFPEGETARQKMTASIPAAFTQNGRELRLSGSKSISKNAFIPAGYTVHISAGSVLTLSGCSFISESPVFIEGTEDQPVTINSQDARGFTVLGANERSSVAHAVFNNFNTQLIPGWTLTGAVNFYESDVDLVNVTIQDNVCEDALNVIRSDFKLIDSKILNAYADGFDADFCTGEVRGCEFRNNQNDCIDFSTSVITISDCTIAGAGDKGVSGGENSQLTLDHMRISGSNIGVASKDLSTVTISNSSITQCRYGYTVFQKKPEFGPAGIFANSVEVSQVDTMQLIEIGSFIEVDGKRMEGELSIDLDKLYDL